MPSPFLKCFVLLVHMSLSRGNSLLLVWIFILDAIATVAAVAKVIALFLFPHPVFDWSGLATVHGKNTNPRIIMLRDEMLSGVTLRPLKT